MNFSLGIIEVTGTVTASACIDVMVKHAFVEVHKVDRAGSGMIAIMIEGDLASVQAALEAGAETALNFGSLVAVKTIPRPDEGLYPFLAAPEKGGQP